MGVTTLQSMSLILSVASSSFSLTLLSLAIFKKKNIIKDKKFKEESLKVWFHQKRIQFRQNINSLNKAFLFSFGPAKEAQIKIYYILTQIHMRH